MKKFRLAVVGGGWSGERPISLLTMQGVVEALQGRGWDVDAIGCDTIDAPVFYEMWPP